MGLVLVTGGGGSGYGSDDCTATVQYIAKGKTAICSGSDDEPAEGTMEVGSILNFSVAAWSGRQILLKWQNPYAAAGRPFGGVFVRYSTTGNPGATGGNWIYTGYGDNRNPGGWAQAIVTLPNLNTKYYFSCTAYCPCSAGDLWGNTLHASCSTADVLLKVISYSQDYKIPSGYNTADIFCVGGGGGGAYGWVSGGGTSGYFVHPGGGGGGGFTSTVSDIAVSKGQILNCSVGAGGAGGNYSTSSDGYGGYAGGATYVKRDGVTLCNANGGNGSDSRSNGGSGGSGGGKGQMCGRGAPSSSETHTSRGGNGGTNGGTGYDGKNRQIGGAGQGYTTRPFGENWGTIYSGGGAGGAAWTQYSFAGGYGGDAGGGNGGCPIYITKNGHSDSEGDYTYPEFSYNILATSGAANTGGGGGGGGCDPAPVAAGIYNSGNGGSGVIMIRLR